MDLLAPVPDKVFFTVPSAYLQASSKSITFEPGAGIYIAECRYLSLNWLVVWCVSYCVTNKFRDEACSDFKSYFGLKAPDGKPFKAQDWHDGIRAGVQFLAAHAKVTAIAWLSKEKIVYPGTFDAIQKPLELKTTADLDKIYGAGFGAKVESVYNDVVKFALNDGFEVPPSDAPVILPPEPIKPPPPVVPAPVPTVPGAIPAWKKPIFWIVGLLPAPVLFLIGLFVPGPIMDIVKAIIGILKKIVGL